MHHPLMKYFQYDHLPEKLQKISKPVCEIALQMAKEISSNDEKTVGLRKLLEAKDCFVRAIL